MQALSSPSRAHGAAQALLVVCGCVLAGDGASVCSEVTPVPSSVSSSARVGTDGSCSSVLGLQESLGLPGVVLSPHSAGALPTSQEDGTLAGEKEPLAAVWPGAACKETWMQWGCAKWGI